MAGTADFVRSIFVETTDESGNKQPSKISVFLNNVISEINAVYQRIVNWPVWGQIADFMAGTADFVADLFTPKVSDKDNTKIIEDAPIAKFISDIGAVIGKIYDETKKILGEIIKDIAPVLSGTWDAIVKWASGEDSNGETVDTGKAEENAEKVTETTDIFSGILQAMTSFVDGVRNFSGWDDAKKLLQTVFDGIKDMLRGIADVAGFSGAISMLKGIRDFIDGIGQIVGMIGSLFKENPWLATGVTAALSTVVYIGKIALEMWTAKKFMKGLGSISISTSFGSDILKMAEALLLVAGAVTLLSTIPEDKLWPAVGAIAGLAAVVAVIYGMFVKNKEVQAVASNKKFSEELIDKLADKLLKIGEIAVIMLLLPPLIDSLGRIDMTKMDNALEILGGISILVVAMGAVAALLGKVSIDPRAALGAALALVAVGVGLGLALISLSGALGIISATSNGFKAFFQDLADVNYLSGTAAVLKETSDSASEIDLDNLRIFESAIKILSELAKYKLNDAAWYSQLFAAEVKFADMPEAFKNLGKSIRSFADGLGEGLGGASDIAGYVEKYDLIDHALNIISSLVEHTAAIKAFAGLGSDLDKINSADILGKWFAAFGARSGINGNNDNITAAANMVTMIETVYADAAKKISGITGAANPLVQAIYDSLISADSRALITSGFQLMAQYLVGSGKDAEDSVEKTEVLDIGSMLGSMFTGEGGLTGILTNLLGGLKIDEKELEKSLGSLADQFNFSSFGKDLSGKLEEQLGGLKTTLGEYSFEEMDLKLFEMDENGNYLEDNWASQLDATMTEGMETIGQNSGEAFLRGLGNALLNANAAMQPFLDENSEIKYAMVPVLSGDDDLGFSADGSMTIIGSVSIDAETVASITASIAAETAKTTAAVNGTTAAVNTLTGRIDSLEDAIRSMKFVLGVNEVSDAVDRTLGAKSAGLNRTMIAFGG